MQETIMATNNYNQQGNENYINYSNNSTSQISSSQSMSLSDIQLFLNKFYIRLINGEQNSPSLCLPVLNNILSEMRNIVMFIDEMEVNVNQFEDLWWDDNNQYVIYDDSDCSHQESSHQEQNLTHFPSSSSSHDDSSYFSSDSNFSQSQLDEDIRVLEDEIFIDSMLNFIDIVAPKSRFNRRKSRRRKNKRTRKSIDPHLRSIWSNSAEVVAPIYSSSCH